MKYYDIIKYNSTYGRDWSEKMASKIYAVQKSPFTQLKCIGVVMYVHIITQYLCKIMAHPKNIAHSKN